MQTGGHSETKHFLPNLLLMKLVFDKLALSPISFLLYSEKPAHHANIEGQRFFVLFVLLQDFVYVVIYNCSAIRKACSSL